MEEPPPSMPEPPEESSEESGATLPGGALAGPPGGAPAGEDEGIVDEHERFYPLLGWRRCFGPFDPHAFAERESRAKPAWAVEIKATAAAWARDRVEHSCWAAEVTDLTDVFGWLYATDFNKFDSRRKGGRAGRRATDVCRRRRWRRAETPRASPSPYDDSDDTMGMVLFWQTLSATAGRRGLSRLPMDATALWRLRRSHAAQYREALSNAPKIDASDAVLVDVAHASLYIRAAYGFAMSEGYMDSVRSGGALFTLKKLHFDIAEHVDDATNTEALRASAGILNDDLLHADWSSRTFQPAHFVALDHAKRWVVVSIRGTLAARDVLTDLSGSQVEYCGGHAHYGFVRAAAFVERRAAAALQAAFVKWPTYDLVLAGHSMGGAVATILAFSARSERSPWPTFNDRGPRVYHLGAAPCLSRDLAVAARAFTIGVVHAKDPAPRISVTSIEQLMDELIDEGCAARLRRTFSRAKPPDRPEPSAVVSSEDGAPAPATEADSRGPEAAAPPEAEAAPAPETEAPPPPEVEAAAPPEAEAADPTEAEAAAPPEAAAPEDAGTETAKGDLSRALADALAKTVSCLGVSLLTPGRIIHLDREAGVALDRRSRRANTPAVAYDRGPEDYSRVLLSYTLMGYHLPKGYLELLFELTNVHGNDAAHGDEAPDRHHGAAHRARRLLRERSADTNWPAPA
ncbi:hypothetical protein M885DRAFT_617608 [Pelagophyceae sp. CCMP2097]|nr:hypothetical protein M885DRAFT_617608 [Pelagophyceae sp. CCMP2097]|mmetsp:Transcript_19918/g.67421  ORF Transcript_19918/g.67421 Transcript_19918/m.67421 type:complete len:687 (-) Transcript_19918:1226-3286(-)